MVSLPEKAKCCGCGACTIVCSNNCIAMSTDKEGFQYPQIDNIKCINCKQCEAVCPVLKKKETENISLEKMFAAFTKNEKVRLNSSSGGIFHEIAIRIINSGGVVFGAAFTDDFREVGHISIERKEDLYKLYGSKYVQSSISESFKQVKNYLESSRVVLFSGTPCQTAALKSFLKKDYENLFTIDFICHGVPSPLIWKEYIKLREKAMNSVVKSVSFRNKKYGWKAFSLKIVFENGKQYLKKFNDDIYMRGFMHDIYLRPSCYQCSFRGTKRLSDISLADFWGVQQIEPDINDNKGISFVIVHSEKGMFFLKKISETIVLRETVKEALSFNPAVSKSPQEPKTRKQFWKAFENYEFSKVMNDFCKVTILDCFKRMNASVVGFAIHTIRKIIPKKIK